MQGTKTGALALFTPAPIQRAPQLLRVLFSELGRVPFLSISFIRHTICIVLPLATSAASWLGKASSRDPAHGNGARVHAELRSSRLDEGVDERSRFWVGGLFLR